MFWLSNIVFQTAKECSMIIDFLSQSIVFSELLLSSLHTNTHTSPWWVCNVLTPIFPQRPTTIYLSNSILGKMGITRRCEVLLDTVSKSTLVPRGTAHHHTCLHARPHWRGAWHEALSWAKVWLTVRVHRPTSWSFLWSPRDMLGNWSSPHLESLLFHLWQKGGPRAWGLSAWCSHCTIFKPATYASLFTIFLLCPSAMPILPSPFWALRGVTLLLIRCSSGTL